MYSAMRRGRAMAFRAAAVVLAAVLGPSRPVTGATSAFLRIGVVSSSGADDVKQVIAVALANRGFTVINRDEMQGAAADFEVSIDSPPGLRAIAGRLQLRGFVDSRTVIKGRQILTTVVVYDGRTGYSVGRATIVSAGSRKKHLENVESVFWERVGPLVERAKASTTKFGLPPRRPPPIPGQADAQAPPAVPWAPVGRLELVAGPRLFSRSLKFW